MLISFKNARLLVIAPHADDEVLGCGGLISKIKSNGGKVFVLIFNIASIEKYNNKKFTELRKKEASAAMKFLNIDKYDTIFDSPNEFKACIAALRPLNKPITNVVISYEAPEHSRWSASGVFQPNLYIDIEKYLTRKISAFYKYKSQVRAGGRDKHTIKNHAEYRGKEVGRKACEAYFVHRLIK